MRLRLMLRALGVSGALAVAGACSSAPFEADHVAVRVMNGSPIHFDSVRVVFPKDDVRYGALTPGEASPYRHVTEAYRYAFVEVWFDGERRVLQPIDFVGESLLLPGRYTYRLGVSDRQHLNLMFIEN